MARVTILDYGSGNLRSAERALHRAGAEVTVTNDASVALSADGLVVPGVGAFAACMRGLHAVEGPSLIAKRVAAGAPVLGICVGMQVLFERGIEHGEPTTGCGQWPGTVERLDADVVPHMGWNTVTCGSGSVLFSGIGTGTRFYFVHSYAAQAWPAQQADDVTLSWSRHGGDFLAAVERGPLSATQFHPEKSGDAGAQLLANWVRTL